MSIEAISREDLEEQLATVRALAPGGAEGVFGPTSVTWLVDREAAIFLGAGRALLLQLAHPCVAAAISEHSRTFSDPIGRFHPAFGAIFGMIFGSLDQAIAAARRLHRRHAAVEGQHIIRRKLSGRLLLPSERNHGAAVGSRHAHREAMARLSGRTRPDLATQVLNQFWIGQRWLA